MLIPTFARLAGRYVAGWRRAEPPFRARLKAWWEGYELDDPEPAGDDADAEADGRPPPRRQSNWLSPGIEAVQRVWGEGSCGPGGDAEILTLVEVLGLGPEMSLLDLGAGLGGPARTMAKKLGVWVTGMEPSPELAQAGMELSTKAGMSKKVPITSYDPETLELPRRKYDCVFAKETFYKVAGKRRLFEEIRKTLKPGGQLLFTDFILNRPRLESKAVRDWIAGEPVEPYPWSLGELLEALDELGLDRAITPTELSEEFNNLIVQGWEACAGFIADQIKSGSFDRELIDALVNEAELWVRRSNALTSGDVRLYRFYAGIA